MKPKAIVLGKELCIDCQEAKERYDKAGYAVEFKNIDKDVDAYALHQDLDGGETIPLVILYGVPHEAE